MDPAEAFGEVGNAGIAGAITAPSHKMNQLTVVHQLDEKLAGRLTLRFLNEAHHRIAMVDNVLPNDVDVLQPAYARFSRRLRASLIDSLILILILVSSLVMMDAVQSDIFSRGLEIVVVAVFLFYEPLLVWKTGSSIGHYLTNLRVVDDRTRGNVSFPKALA